MYRVASVLPTRSSLDLAFKQDSRNFAVAGGSLQSDEPRLDTQSFVLSWQTKRQALL